MGQRYYRAHQRFPVRLEAVIVAHRRGRTVRAEVIDLGLGGLAAEADGPLRHGEAVLIRLEPPDSAQPIELTGNVAWVAWTDRSSVRVGIHLVEEDEDTLLPLLHRLGLSVCAV